MCIRDRPWFAALNKSLLDCLDDAAFRDRIRQSTQLMRSLAAEIAERAEASAGVAAPALAQLRAEPLGGVQPSGTAAKPLLFATATGRRAPVEVAAA